MKDFLKACFIPFRSFGPLFGNSICHYSHYFSVISDITLGGPQANQWGMKECTYVRSYSYLKFEKKSVILTFVMRRWIPPYGSLGVLYTYNQIFDIFLIFSLQLCAINFRNFHIIKISFLIN
jgi:hypothetical protein